MIGLAGRPVAIQFEDNVGDLVRTPQGLTMLADDEVDETVPVALVDGLAIVGGPVWMPG